MSFKLATKEASPGLLLGEREGTREDLPLSVLLADRVRLMQITAIAGEDYGTEDLALFLFSLVRMYKPKTILELGTGLGICSLWLGLAAKENSFSHLWTIDNFDWSDRHREIAGRVVSELHLPNSPSVKADATSYYTSLSAAFDLVDVVTFVKSHIALREPKHFDRYSFATESLDFVFSDFCHGREEILRLLAQLLPRLAPVSSIIIHSASTSWGSYLLLEQLVMHLQSGRVPASMQSFTSVDLQPLVRNRRISLTHIVEDKDRSQNSAAWLHFEPIDVFPYPKSRMRS